MRARRELGLLLAVLLVATGLSAAQEKNLVDYSIVGSNSCDKKPCYDDVISKIPVQKLFLDLAAAPVDAATVESALKQAGVPLSDVLQLRLIRREGGRYFLNFPLFTAADVVTIKAASDRYAASLAQALLERRHDIESALLAYGAPGVDRKAVAYVVLGCVSLDWDGLDITASKGYRKTTEDRPDGKYVPAAEQKSEVSLQRIYWGSHNSQIGEAYFTSFGDHFSPRYTLPDLIWRVPGRIADTQFPADIQRALRSLLAEALNNSGDEMGRIMLALRSGEKTKPELARSLAIPEANAGVLLDTLSELQFVRLQDGRYQAAVPVLTERDKEMVDKLRAIGRQVMESWLAANYPHIKSDLNHLSFTRSGVPFEDGFTMIWHYIFGITNAKLVEAGLFADPYDEARKYKGSIPMVYSSR